MSAAKKSSSTPGGSAPLTPANKISEDVFDSTFIHTEVETLHEFRRKLEPAVEKWGGNKYDDIKVKPPPDLTKACGETESVLRDHLKIWFNKILSKSARKRRRRAKKPASAEMLNDGTKEGQLNTVFDNYKRKIQEDFAYALEEFPDDPRGSLVTASSKRDLAFYVPTSKILFHGELKNNAKYKKVDAIRQCAGYLFFQLWWFRTVQHKDVEAVYGFTVCGSKCSADTDSKGKDNQGGEKKVEDKKKGKGKKNKKKGKGKEKDEGKKKVIVSLLILKVPQETKSIKPSIGGKFELYEFSKAYPENSTNAFDHLASFLLTDFVNPFKKPEIPEQFSCPGCMLMPPSWLRESGEQNNSDWALIKTGTGSLVIRCNNKDVVRRLLQNHVGDRDEGQKEDLVTVQEAVPGSKKWILKCKTPASGKGWESAKDAINLTILDLRNQLSREGNNDFHDIAGKWLDMYPVQAVVDGRAGRSIVVMKYIGKRFSASKISYAKFISEFKMLIDRVLTIEKKTLLVHGDIHEGNIRLDKKGDVGWKLRLIDWDEASRDFPLERIAVTDEQKKRYPKCLRKLENNLYTKNQLLLLFSSLNNKYEKDEQTKQWGKIQGVNWEQLDIEVDYKEAIADDVLPAEVTNKYNKLYEAIKGFKNQRQGQTTHG